jgi:hypothetical protein
MRTLYALALALPLAACGLAGTWSDTSHIVVKESTRTNGYAGWTEWGVGPTEVRVYPPEPMDFFRDERRTTAIIAHELWHAMTQDSGHAADADCISHVPFDIDLVTRMLACPEDVRAVPAGRVWQVTAQDFPNETRAAIHYWNAALGREALLLND